MGRGIPGCMNPELKKHPGFHAAHDCQHIAPLAYIKKMSARGFHVRISAAFRVRMMQGKGTALLGKAGTMLGPKPQPATPTLYRHPSTYRKCVVTF
jgi:hypothetical protein